MTQPRPTRQSNRAIEAALLDVEIETKTRRIAELPEETQTGDALSLINTTAEFVVVFSTETGVASKIRVERLRDKIMPDRATGKAAFSLEPANPDWRYIADKVTGVPLKVNPRGLKCYLHEEADRDTLDELGLGELFCPKANIPTPFMLRLHMQRKHNLAWQTLEEHRREQREKATQADQLELLRALVAANALKE